VRMVAVEPEACPTLTRGEYLYDFGDTVATTPLLKMYTLGHGFVPPAIHAGGLRYHGDAPLICLLYHHKYLEAVAYPQRTVFDAAVRFARAEGYPTGTRTSSCYPQSNRRSPSMQTGGHIPKHSVQLERSWALRPRSVRSIPGRDTGRL